MPAFITDIRIYPELSASPVGWLLGNIFGKRRAEIDFYVATYALATTDNTFIYNPSAGYLGAGWIVAEQSDAFKDFRQGDFIFIDTAIITGGVSFLIQTKLSDHEIQVSTSITAPVDSIANNDKIYVTTPITGIKFFHNLIENADQADYFSLIDGSEQLQFRKTVDANDTTTYDLFNAIPLNWQSSNSLIKGRGFILPNQSFTLIHNFYIVPFFLSDQWDDLKAGIAPDYFKDEKCLKYAYKIQAMYDFNNPNEFQEVEVGDVLGNTGWFNENFNKQEPVYQVDSVSYTRADLSGIPSLELTEEVVNCEVIISNETTNPFSDGNTKFVLNFCKAPASAGEYQQPTATENVQENFYFDRALQTVGSAAVNGDEFGSQWQVLTNITAEFIDTSHIKIKFSTQLSSFIVESLSALGFQRYIIAIEIQNHLLDTSVADNVCLLVDANDFLIDNSDPGMLINTMRFLNHIENTYEEGDEVPECFPEDELVAYSRFYIDRNTREADTILLKTITANMVARNSVSSEFFNLDAFTTDVSNIPLIGDSQFIDFSLDRIFHIPPAEIRKTIRIIRRQDLDDASKRYYDVVIPYLFRWEYFTALPVASADFFDPAQPNKGWNEFWFHYTTKPNWGVYFELKILASKNGEALLFDFQKQIPAVDYNSNADWTGNIKSYNNQTNQQLFDVPTSRNFFLGFAETRVEAALTKISAIPVLANITVVLRVEVYEQGGISGQRRMSSKYASDADTWFKSIDSSNKVVLSLSGNTVIAKALIDNSKIPFSASEFKITARIYEGTSAPIAGKQFQDGESFEFQDGSVYEFQN